MTLDQINNLTVVSVQQILIARLEEKELEVTEITLKNELQLYKQELIEIENARLAELARINDIKSRWNSMPDIRLALTSLGNYIPNPAIELKRIIAEDDQDYLAQLESAYVIESNNLANKAIKEQRKNSGRIAREACLSALDIIAGYNIERNLTKEQKDQMLVNFSGILQALQSNRPGLALALITATEPDGVLITQEIKDEVIADLNSFLV
jgi:hypothetical protein